jgi:hypothetical protein
MGVGSEDNHKMGEQDSVPSHDDLVQPPAAEQAGEQRTEGRSVTVVTSSELAELQRRLDAAES